MSTLKNEVFRNFSIGFLPIAIFLIADWLYGAMIGIAFAIVFAFGELLFFYIKNKIFEKFIVFDLALLLVFGSVSLLLENDFFFKLKPAVFEIILVIVLGIHGYTNKPIVLLMGKRYFPKMEMDSTSLSLLKLITRILSVVFLVHTFLIVWSAYFWSKEAWVFISGVLFYIIFGALLLLQFIFLKFFKTSRLKKYLPVKTDNKEMFDIVNVNGKILGKAARSEVHGNPNLIHATVHLHVFNKQGHLFLQKRVSSKDLYPGRWDTAVGGHVNSGEAIYEALLREAREELALDAKQAIPLFRYIMRNSRESELIHTYKITSEGPFKLAADEIDEGRFWTGFELRKNMGMNIFTPNFEEEFKMLIKAGLM